MQFSTEAEAIYIPVPGIRGFPLLYSLSDIYCRMGVLVFHCYLFSLLSSSLLCDAEVRPLRTLFPRLPSWLTQILATEGKLEGGRNGEWVSSWFFWCLLASLQQYQLTLVAIWFWHHQKQPHSFPWEVLVQLLTVSSMVSMEPVFRAPRSMKPHLLLVIPALFNIIEPVIVQSLSHVWLSDPMDCTTPGFPVLHHLPDFSQTQVHWLDDAIQSFHPLSPPFPPAFNLSQHRVFSNELALYIRWSKYWNFSISLSNEYSVLISFRIDWFLLFEVQGTLKSLLQQHNSKASILQCSAFFMAQSSHPYMTTGKTIALTTQTFVGKIMSLLFNTLFRFIISSLPRSKHSLISWVQSPSTVILKPEKIKSVTASIFSSSIWTQHCVWKSHFPAGILTVRVAKGQADFEWDFTGTSVRLILAHHKRSLTFQLWDLSLNGWKELSVAGSISRS